MLAMAPSSSQTVLCGPTVRFGEAPKPAREGACAPRKAGRVAPDFHLTLLAFATLVRARPGISLEKILELGVRQGTGETIESA
jgi:hypothetical protein